MILALSCVVVRAICVLALRQEPDLPRKTRSYSEPFDPGYIYKHINDVSNYSPNTFSDDSGEPYFNNDYFMPSYSEQSVKYMGDVLDLSPKYMELLQSSKIDALAPYQRSEIYYHPSKTKAEIDYNIRKNSIHHDQLPYYYHNPHEYEQMKIDSEIEKAKDKRYAVDAARIIPIHEDLTGDVPHSYEPLVTTPVYHNYNEETTTENPLSGHDPFFSFTLNNLFNDVNYDDRVSSKGNWGRDFDRQVVHRDIDDSPKVGRSILSNVNYYDDPINYHLDSNEVSDARSVINENNNKLGIQKHEKENLKKDNDEARYKEMGNHGITFKNIGDAFVNKFGSGDQKKHMNYIATKNQGKGENRKGFRRVYHKDEYQEDNEFYDNNNSSAVAKDGMSTHAHIGGSEGLLKSNAVAELGDKSNAYDMSRNNNNKNYESDYKGYLNNRGLDFIGNRAEAHVNVPNIYSGK